MGMVLNKYKNNIEVMKELLIYSNHIEKKTITENK